MLLNLGLKGAGPHFGRRTLFLQQRYKFHLHFSSNTVSQLPVFPGYGGGGLIPPRLHRHHLQAVHLPLTQRQQQNVARYSQSRNQPLEMPFVLFYQTHAYINSLELAQLRYVAIDLTHGALRNEYELLVALA